MGAIIGGAADVVKNGLVGCGIVGLIFGIGASETGPGALPAAGGGCLLGGAAAIVAGAPETVVVAGISGVATLGWQALEVGSDYYQEMSTCSSL
jgi:hypothetical protein